MHIKKYLTGIFACLLLAACEKQEDIYKDFLKDGVIIYTARVDSLKAFAGDNRIALSWLLTSDPKITQCRVFWNNGADSVNVPVQRTSGVDTVRVTIPGLNENVYAFHVYTYDSKGHSSVKEEVIGTSYGAVYQATLANRPVRKASYKAASQRAEIIWFGISPEAVAVDIEYTNETGQTVQQREVALKHPTDPNRPAKFNDTTFLEGYKQGTEIRYRTAYKPESTAIDTFYTQYEPQTVQ